MEEEQENLLNEEDVPDDGRWELTLRPRWLREYIGQPKIRQNLDIFIQAAKSRGEPLEHILLYGGPGLGKTSLAHVIANEIGAHMRVTTGPAIEKAGDLAAILSNLEEGDVLFVDEIHRLPRVVEEILYPAMEDFALDIVVGQGPTARTVRLDLPRFTLIGATTKLSLMSAPLRDRFGVVYHLDFYDDNEIGKILRRSADILKLEIEGAAVGELATRARQTPRIANRLLRRVRDYAQVYNEGKISGAMALKAMDLLEIDPLGMDKTDRLILKTIIDKFGGGPVGLNTIAASIAEEISAIENIYEPFLLQKGFLERTTRGRKATRLAWEYLDDEKRANRE